MAEEKIVYQLKVTLRGIRPSIWRRFQVPKDITLYRLHSILQAVMGWTDSHLHQFRVGNIFYGTPDPEFDFEVKSEREVRLPQHPAAHTSSHSFGDEFIRESEKNKEKNQVTFLKSHDIRNSSLTCPLHLV